MTISKYYVSPILVICSIVIFFIFTVVQPENTLAEGESIIFSDDFSSGSLNNWSIENNDAWSIPGGVLRGEGGDWASTREEFFDERFHVSFRIKLIGEELHINLRNGNSGRYFIGFSVGGTVLNKQYWPETFLSNLASSDSEFAQETWYTIEIIHDGNELLMVVDDVEQWRYEDSDPLNSGNFGFELFDNTPVEIDDVFIYGQVQETISPWISTGGPLGGLGYDIRFHPDNSDIMFVTDANAGVFKSQDGGENWIANNAGIDARTGSTNDLIPVFCLSFDPNNGDILWVGTADVRGIYRSDDGGENWQRKTNGIIESSGITFRGITVEPGNSNVVYAAAEISSGTWNGSSLDGREFDMTQGVVYKTTDAGENWTAVWRGYNLARYILIDPSDTNILYISTGIFDREAANSDPDTPSRTVPGGEGILKSTNAGQTWVSINDGLFNLYVGSLAIHPEDSNFLIAATGNNQYYSNAGVYYSNDGGNQWTKASGINEMITAVEFSLSNTNIAYAGSSNAIYRSENKGQSWTLVGQEEWGPEGIRAGFPIDFLISKNDPDHLFINNYGGGNFVSRDGGSSWENASQGYTGAQVKDIIVDPDNPGNILAAARSGLFISHSGGSQWEGRNYGSMKVLEWNAIAMMPGNNQQLLAGSNWNNAVSLSTDGGYSWESVGENLSDNQAWRVIVYGSAARVYAGSGGYFSAGSFDTSISASGMQRSDDGGDTWNWINSGLMSDAHITSIAVASDNEDYVLAATANRGILFSLNGGDNWQQLSNGLPDMAALSVAIHTNNNSIMYAGFESGGLYITEDAGSNWQILSSGLNPEGQITEILLDTSNPEIMYVADKSSGVYRSENAGTSWLAMNTQLSNRDVNSLTLSGDGLYLYAATEGAGVFRMDIDGIVPDTYSETNDNEIPSNTGARLENGILHIPVVDAGFGLFEVWLNTVSDDPVIFELTDVKLAGSSEVDAYFVGNRVSLAELEIDNISYQVELDFVAGSSPLRFVLVSSTNN